MEKDHSMAWNRALSELRKAHKDEFKKLYDQHRYEINAERAIWGEVHTYKGRRD